MVTYILIISLSNVSECYSFNLTLIEQGSWMLLESLYNRIIHKPIRHKPKQWNWQSDISNVLIELVMWPWHPIREGFPKFSLSDWSSSSHHNSKTIFFGGVKAIIMHQFLWVWAIAQSPKKMRDWAMAWKLEIYLCLFIFILSKDKTLLNFTWKYVHRL